jgi:anti-sigma factor RsiW
MLNGHGDVAAVLCAAENGRAAGGHTKGIVNLEQQLKLQAFLDGELPEREAREILAWTQRDSAAASLLAELKNTRAAMTKSEPHLSVPESREFFWSKIEREIQRTESRVISTPRVSIFTSLRRFLLPASAVATVVIAGMIAHFEFPNNAPKAVVENVADADTTTVETTLANSDATTYRDASEGTTLVWFSSTDDSPAQNKKSAIN